MVGTVRTWTPQQFQEMDQNQEGGCLYCGSTQGPVEPDARRYKCETCGRATVFGAEELLVMGRVV